MFTMDQENGGRGFKLYVRNRDHGGCTFIENEKLNIIMEYCDKGDLNSYLKAQKSNGKYLKEERIWHFFIQICSGKLKIKKGLSLIHKRNILHRDLKSLNFHLKRDHTETERAKISKNQVLKKKMQLLSLLKFVYYLLG